MIDPPGKLYPEFKETLPDVSGKVFVVTGTTSGTGFVAAHTIAEKGGEVLLLNRQSERATNALKRLQEGVPSGTFVPIECDLQSFASVRDAAEQIRAKYDSIYCLLNNAGIMATPDEATVDGYDTQMQTNHLSHFLLTALLLPLLEKSAETIGDARVVSHSSFGRDYCVNKRLEEKYFGKNGGHLGGNEVKLMGGACYHRYFQTKLACSVFTHGLHNKLTATDSKIRAVSAHPGGSKTNLSNNSINEFGFFSGIIVKLSLYFCQEAADGAMGIMYGAMHPDAQSGVLYGPAKSGLAGAAVPNPPKDYETNEEDIDMLWRTSEAATGVKLL